MKVKTFKNEGSLLGWIEECINPLVRKGEQWYERLNSWYDFEQKERNKGIAINVRTGEYIIAQTPFEAREQAKMKFGSVPLFSVWIHPYAPEALLQVIDQDGAIPYKWFYHVRSLRWWKECDILSETFEEKIKKLPEGMYVVASTEKKSYVVGKTLEEAEEKAEAEFPQIMGEKVYHYVNGIYFRH